MAADDGGAIPKVRDVLKLVRDTAPLAGTEDLGYQENVGKITGLLREVCGEFGELELTLSTNRIMMGEGDVVYKSEARDNNLAFDLFRQGLRKIIFKPGVQDAETESFVSAFAECRDAEELDEDFISTLWKEELPNVGYVALDGFTEKIFMSEERFVASFRGVLAEVAPGLIGMEEDDPGDDEPRARVVFDEAKEVLDADTAALRIRRDMKQGEAGPIAKALGSAQDDLESLNHLVHLLACLAVKAPSPLPIAELGEVIVQTLSAYLEREGWQEFADALRSLRQLVDAAGDFESPLDIQLRELKAHIGGVDLVEALADHMPTELPNFTAYTRWHFASLEVLSAPDILKVINRCENRHGKDFLKDLLRRQGTASLDPWAERLQDPNPGVVLEVLEVILSSELGPQARPLLLETLKHENDGVRAKAIQGLAGDYDQSVRQALLPLIKDPSSRVRRAIMARVVGAGDRSVAPYVASAIRSNDLFMPLDEDEQRLYFEALARLGGPRFLDVFKQRLEFKEESGGGGLKGLFKRGDDTIQDNPMRRAAISGLAAMEGQQGIQLIRKVHGKASLELASHCEVSLRLASRGEAGGAAEAAAPPDIKKSAEPEDPSVGESKMGEGRIFELADLRGPAPKRARPTDAEILSQSLEEGPGKPSAQVPARSAAAQLPDLGARPLLGHHETFLPDDRRRLKAWPAEMEGPRFTLRVTGATLVGVGLPQQATLPPLVGTPAPTRVVEKKSVAATGADMWSHNPKASLDDILMSYLTTGGEDTGAPQPARPPRPTGPPPRRSTVRRGTNAPAGRQTTGSLPPARRPTGSLPPPGGSKGPLPPPRGSTGPLPPPPPSMAPSITPPPLAGSITPPPLAGSAAPPSVGPPSITPPPIGPPSATPPPFRASAPPPPMGPPSATPSPLGPPSRTPMRASPAGLPSAGASPAPPPVVRGSATPPPIGPPSITPPAMREAATPPPLPPEGTAPPAMPPGPPPIPESEAPAKEEKPKPGVDSLLADFLNMDLGD